MGEEQRLRELRREIGEVTSEIFELVEKRLALAREIGRIKSSLGLSVKDSEAEIALRKEIREISEERDMDEDFCIRLLDLLIEESVRLQEIEKDSKKNRV